MSTDVGVQVSSLAPIVTIENTVFICGSLRLPIKEKTQGSIFKIDPCVFLSIVYEQPKCSFGARSLSVGMPGIPLQRRCPKWTRSLRQAGQGSRCGVGVQNGHARFGKQAWDPAAASVSRMDTLLVGKQARDPAAASVSRMDTLLVGKQVRDPAAASVSRMDTLASASRPGIPLQRWCPEWTRCLSPGRSSIPLQRWCPEWTRCLSVSRPGILLRRRCPEWTRSLR